MSDSNNFTTVNSEFDTGDIKIYQNVIETTNSNSDLELRSYTGRIKTADVFFDNPTTIVGNITASRNILATGSIHTLGHITASGNISCSGELFFDTINGGTF